MFIVWQGFGFVGVLIPIVFVLLGQLGIDAALGNGYYSSHPWAPALCLILSAVALWFFGSKLNNRPGRELIDPKTQERIILKKKHTVFWVPVQYFSILVAVIAVFMLLK
ncbi:hypothetical protein [Paraherbaspirillum soli]|uniref:Uncharacterized protein n=1 Tax=Paraherbaspirillum soli TaxID=631222 RepID=A0ABW0MFZ1_9BURK